MPPVAKPRNQHRRQWEDMADLAAFKKTLRAGVKLDVFDTSSVPPQWMEAEVTAVHRSSIDVHFVGWSDRYDTSVDSVEYKQRIARHGSYSEEVVHYSCCMLCDDGGDNRPLVCCDGCPRVVHLQCVKLRQLPKGDYFCPDCVKHRRGKRSVKHRDDPTHREEDEPDGEEEEEEEEGRRVAGDREKENRANRAGTRTSSPSPSARKRRAPVKTVQSTHPAASASSASSTLRARSTDARPSDRRALATKAGRPRLADGAGLRPTGQREAPRDADSTDEDEDDEVMELTERKEQPPPARKRARDDDSGADQERPAIGAITRRSRAAALSAPSLSPSQSEACLPPIPQPAPAPPIHLAAGVSSAGNQSSRKRIRAGGAQQQPQQQQQQHADDEAASSASPSDEEKKESSIDSKQSAGTLNSFVDCYRYHASRRGRNTSSASSTASSQATSSLTADGLPLSGLPPFSFPPSNFDELAGDAYLAQFCSLLDMADDKVSLSVPAELPGVERWELIRARMEEVGGWMRMKCNQQINGEQSTVRDGHQTIERQTKQWREQLQSFEQQLTDATEQRKTAVTDIAAIDAQIAQLKQQREQRMVDVAKRDSELSRLSANREDAKREHDRRVSEQEASIRKATHRVRMLRDLSEHVAARRQEGDQKEQTGQFWEPLDTIQRRCATLTAAMRLREADRTNSNSGLRREKGRQMEEKQQPADADDEQKDDRRSELQRSVTEMLDDCVDAANFATQSVRHSQERDGYPLSSLVDAGYHHDVEAAAELHSGDVPTALLDGPSASSSSVFPSNVRLSSASFGSLSSLSSASTVSEVPHVALSSGTEDSVSSTQTTLPVSPSQQHQQLQHELALEGWKVQRMEQQRQQQQQRRGAVEEHTATEVQQEREDEDDEKQGVEHSSTGGAALESGVDEAADARRTSGENMDVLTAAAEEEFTPEKRTSPTRSL